MKSLIQEALGDAWDQLPPALQAHYQPGTCTDTGHLDIDYPPYMHPLLTLLRTLGALVNQRGKNVATVVRKTVVGQRQYWHRTMTFANGRTLHFNSFWVASADGQVIEFVNPVLGLQMQPYVEGQRLHYRGIRYVAKLGPLLLPIPEWLVLGHTTIVEEALDAEHFAMDFRLTHPLLGQVFRYAGRFKATVQDATSQAE